MLLEAMTRLYEYNAWAMDRVLTVSEQLKPADFTAQLVAGLPCVRDTLVHTLDAQVTHLSWWDGSMTPEEAWARQFPRADYPDAASVRRMWQDVRAGTGSFLSTLTDDADLGRVYVRRRRDGAESRRPLWEMMLHVANHGTHHRSEVAVMLTAAGHSPGDLDIL